MPTDPAIQTSERTPIVAALLSLPGVTQIGRAFGIGGIAPSSEAVDASASKISPTSRGRRGDRGRAQARNARIRGMAAFLNQTSPSRGAYDGGGSGRENSPGAMASATKASISVIPIGESTGPVYTDFILTGVAEQDVEKTEVVETFGAFHLFSSGRFARKYQFTGMARAHPTNHSARTRGSRGTGYSALNVPAGVKLRNLYETYLRATVQATRQTFTRITVDRDSYDGWITTLNLTRDANNEFFTTFSFTMVAFRRTHEKDGSAQALLKTFDAVAGQTQKPIARMKAEVAASVGACQPVWYVNGSRQATTEGVTVREDDAGLACLRNLRITLRSESGEGTAIGGTCKLTASIGGKAVELSAVGVAKSTLNLTSPQSVFSDDVVYRSVAEIGAGKNSVPLEVTATGTDSTGHPVSAVLTIPLKVIGVAAVRVSGFKVYRASDSALLSTLTFPTNADAQLKYGEVVDDSVPLEDNAPVAGARNNSSSAPTTAFGYYVEPTCVDSKTGTSVSAPADLQLRLTIYDYPDHVAESVLGGLTAGKALVSHTFDTNFSTPGGTDELQKKGAASIDLVINAVPQESAPASPTATLRVKFPTVSAPFPFVSKLYYRQGSGATSTSLTLLYTVRPGMSPAGAEALALRFAATSPVDQNGFSATLEASGGVIAGPDRTLQFLRPKATAFSAPFPGSSTPRMFVLVRAFVDGPTFINGVRPYPSVGSVTVRPPIGVPAPNSNDSLFTEAWRNLPT